MRDALIDEIVSNKFSITLGNYDAPLELVVLEGLNQVVARHAPVDQLHLRLVVVRFAVVGQEQVEDGVAVPRVVHLAAAGVEPVVH